MGNARMSGLPPLLSSPVSRAQMKNVIKENRSSRATSKAALFRFYIRRVARDEQTSGVRHETRGEMGTLSQQQQRVISFINLRENERPTRAKLDNGVFCAA